MPSVPQIQFRISGNMRNNTQILMPSSVLNVPCKIPVHSFFTQLTQKHSWFLRIRWYCSQIAIIIQQLPGKFHVVVIHHGICINDTRSQLMSFTIDNNPYSGLSFHHKLWNSYIVGVSIMKSIDKKRNQFMSCAMHNNW